MLMDGRMWEEGLHNTDKTFLFNFILFIYSMKTWTVKHIAFNNFPQAVVLMVYMVSKY